MLQLNVCKNLLNSNDDYSFPIYRFNKECPNTASRIEYNTISELYNKIKTNYFETNDFKLEDLINFGFNSNIKSESIILTKNKITIFCVNIIKAILTPNDVFVVIPNDVGNFVSALSNYINLWNQSADDFETHVYKTLFYVCHLLNEQEIKSIIIEISLEMTNFGPVNHQKKIKNNISEKTKNIANIKKMLNDLLANGQLNEATDEKIITMIQMNLYKFGSLLTQIEMVSEKIKHSEEFSILKLEYTRNKLMILNTILTIIMCVIGFCSYVAGLFGMNLDNVDYIQPINGIFNSVVISTIIFIPVMTILMTIILNKLNYLPNI